jgi:hypothetical protein
MKHLIYFFALLAVTPSARIVYADAQEVRACDFEVKARCVSGDARVTLAGGVVKRVEVGVYWCGPPHHLGYTCTIDSSRDDEDSQWSEDGGATLITNPSPANPNESDRVKITIGEKVLIDLTEAQSLGRCGAGAALPRTIVIPAQKGACRVRLGTP